MEAFNVIFFCTYLLSIIFLGMEFDKRNLNEDLISFILILTPFVNTIIMFYFIIKAFKAYDWNKFK